ncbi:hypothetical protein [Kutzneria sp. NPDC052558]|uniref:hypothetical protein n=1 Tax=Kutzneria sp. NPDC052558 TaxID=3364121 RepID=UPI0037CC5246
MSELASWNGEQPQIKLLDPVLFEQLGAGGGAYEELLLAEYGRPGQVIERAEVPHGLLHYIQFDEQPGRPAWTTHLIFARATEPQVREYLVTIGLGSVEIHTVYGATERIEDAPDEVDEL